MSIWKNWVSYRWIKIHVGSPNQTIWGVSYTPRSNDLDVGWADSHLTRLWNFDIFFTGLFVYDVYVCWKRHMSNIENPLSSMIIHFRLGLSKNLKKKQQFWISPWLWKPPNIEDFAGSSPSSDSSSAPQNMPMPWRSSLECRDLQRPPVCRCVTLRPSSCPQQKSTYELSDHNLVNGKKMDKWLQDGAPQI